MTSEEEMYHDPDGLLRPNAPVEAVFHHQGRRPFVLRFTTAGVDSPSATPMPRTFGPPTPAPLPTPNP
jgi:hypothetical protein